MTTFWRLSYQHEGPLTMQQLLNLATQICRSQSFNHVVNIDSGDSGLSPDLATASLYPLIIKPTGLCIVPKF